MSTVADWFFRWLETHKSLNNHNGFRTFEEPDKITCYFGWIEAFEEFGVIEADARTASVQLQRRGEFWPVEHLQALLKILGPILQERRTREAQEARRQRDQADEAMYLEFMGVKARWMALPESDREAYREQIRTKLPALTTHKGFLERLAIGAWQGMTIPDAPPPLMPAAPPPEPASPREIPLTDSQIEMVASLSEECRQRLDTISPAKFVALLRPFAQKIDPTLIPIIARELATPKQSTPTE